MYITWYSIKLCLPEPYQQTWQRRNKIALQHRLEESVDLAMLLMTHMKQQRLDKVHLLGL